MKAAWRLCAAGVALAMSAGGLTGTASAAQRRAVAVDIRLGVASDGSAPFNQAEGPGQDAGPVNGIVRTNDTITYAVNVNVTGGTAQNERFTLRAPAGTEWVRVPPECKVPPSKIDGLTLTCGLGDLTNTSTRVDVALRVTGARTNGDVITTTATVTADNAAVKDVPAPDPATTTVSSQPRFDLIKDRFAAYYTSADGPNGEPGQLVTWPIVVENRPAETGIPLKLGTEQLRSPLTFTDDLSELLNGAPAPGARLYTWGAKHPTNGCGTNDYGGNGVFNSPGGAGGRDHQVTDSGTMACTQTAPGQAIGVTITGADTTATHTPLKGLYDSLPADNGYVISSVITVWIPQEDLDAAAKRAGKDSVTIRNTLTGFDPTGVSGQSNFGAATEPTANNSRELSIKVSAGTDGGDKNYILPNGSGRGGRRHVTPGEQIPGGVIIRNTGTPTLNPLVTCDMFDNTVQSLDPSGVWATVDSPNTRIEYAAAPAGALTPAALSKLSCDDGAGPWFDDPAKVPGGPPAVNRVRTVGPLAGNSSRGLRVNLRVREDVAPQTRIRNFGSWKAPQIDGGDWHYTTNDPGTADGVLADFLITTPVLARITKKTVDTGTTAADTPDKLSQVATGSKVTFALYPSLTKSGGATGPQDVTITDVLPAGLKYSGTASPQPTGVVENQDGTTTLTWVLKQRVPGEVIAPITVEAMADPETPPGSRLNRAVISTPLDTSPEAERSAQRAVELVLGKSILIIKRPVRPVVIVGDTLDYDIELRNLTGSTLSSLTAIDVLPWVGDARNPSSSFKGRAGLAAVPQAGPGDVITYSSDSPRSISLNPNAPSNGTGGSTRWCTQADFGKGGCPAELAGVTALRIRRAGPIPVGAIITTRLRLTNKDQAAGDIYTNRVGAASPDLDLPVESLDYPERVVAGCIGDYAWLDANKNGVQDTGERPLPGTHVRLAGNDDRKAAVKRTTTTDGKGHYLFERLRPGSYELTFTPPKGGSYSFTVRKAGGDTARDSDASARGVAGPVTLESEGGGADLKVGCDRTIDAGLIRKPETRTTKPGLRVAKTADRRTVRAGDVVRYTIKATNIGDGAYTANRPARFTDDLTKVLRATRYRNDATASAGQVTYAKPRLTWSGPLRPGQTATITYTVKVTKARGWQLVNTVTTPGPSNCKPRSADPRCTTKVELVPPGKLKDRR